MEFEWDPEKALGIFAKHGVGFEEATTVFGRSTSRTIRDPEHSVGELRFLTIGLTEPGKLVVVAHADRGDRIRVISARLATGREREHYESEE